jgi:hypothetical protein
MLSSMTGAATKIQKNCVGLTVRAGGFELTGSVQRENLQTRMRGDTLDHSTHARIVIDDQKPLGRHRYVSSTFLCRGL